LPSVRDLGERKIIELIFNVLEKMPNMVLPFGDDASAVNLGDGRLAVLKSDMLVGMTDVPSGMSLWQAARKAVVMNVSDLAAKGVKPIALLTSVGFPSNFNKENVLQISRGLNTGAREYGAYVIGGDTSETSDLIIACLLFGIGFKKEIMKRSGAMPGDILAVTGYFGKTSAGLKIIKESMECSPKLRKGLLESVYMPKARLKEGVALAKTSAVTSSIDSSDGLAWSLHELSKMGKVGFIIETLPIANEVKRFSKLNNLNADQLVLYGGEEYELVVTIKPRSWIKAKKAVEKVGGKLVKIGFATKERGIFLKIKGEEKPIEPRGWEHFKSV
jgi:thiamine-monophosphate kinase